MKIIDGKGATMGRLATYVAKEALKGHEIVVLNCNDVIVTGNKTNIKDEFNERRNLGGNSLKGPKHPKISYHVVKRAIRGMLPDHRTGRGREAFKRIKCYNNIPKEFEGKEMLQVGKDKKIKYISVKEMLK